MKSKFTILLLFTMMAVAAFPTAIVASADEVPPAEFKGITVDGEALESNIVKFNTTVKISYTAERFEVDGVILLGVGNNLTENIDDAVAANFSLNEDRAKGPTKFFSIEVNVKEFVKFYAYTWKGNYSNGSYEKFDTFDEALEGKAYHYIWVKDQDVYPQFSDVINGERQDPREDFVAPLGTNVSVRYTVQSNTNESDDRVVTLSISDNQTNVLDGERSSFINMTWLNYDNVSKTHLFEYNFTVSKRVLFFAAFNSKGWERVAPTESRVHRLSTEFSFNADYENYDSDFFSDIDQIYSNITAINKTDEDRFFMRYRVANDSDDIAEVEWTDVQLFNITTPTILNSSISNNTVTIYAFDLNMTLNFSLKIELQAYVKYLNFTEYRASKVFDIFDSRPDAEIFGDEFRYTNSKTALIEFKVSPTKGKLESVQLQTKLNGSNFIDNSFEVKGKPNLSTRANQTVSLNVGGVHLIVLNATSTFNRSRIIEIAIHADFTPPVGILNLAVNSSDENPGFVQLEFSYTDSALNDTGIDKVYLDWGNGLVEDVTGLNSSSYTYTRSGTYEIVLTIWDLAGNNVTVPLTVTIGELPGEQVASTQNASFPILGILSGIMIIVYMKRKSSL